MGPFSEATTGEEGGKDVEELLWLGRVFTSLYNSVLSYDWDV